MKKNGFSIIELIISIGLLSIVLIFMFNLLIKLSTKKTSAVKYADIALDQALISKDLNKDISLSGGISSITCSSTTTCTINLNDSPTKTISISEDKKSLTYSTATTAIFVKKLSENYEFEKFVLTEIEYDEENFYKLSITIKDNPKYNIEIYSYAQAVTRNYTVGQIFNFPYTGTVQTLKVLDSGVYQLQVWGAQGGYQVEGYGGMGGYSVGEVSITAGTILNIYVGGSGNSGGFNGGGIKSYYPGGGGATDIRVGGISLYNRFIVAGGGGSDGSGSRYGGYGGGTSGGSITVISNVTGGLGASQTAGATNGGSFGKGGNGIDSTSTTSKGGSGGGGWYGGGYTHATATAIGHPNFPGGGGSGYVWTAATAGSAPSGYLVGTQYYLSNASTSAGNTSFSAPGGGNETGHSGDGYARITVVSLN